MVFRKLSLYGELVMFRHTIFAMPFAAIGTFLAAGGFPSFYQFFWIVMAMIGARNGANALNRVVDKDIDEKNPRTSGRLIPKGIIKNWEALALTAACFLLFTLSAFMLQPICAALLPVPMALFILYSYTKRFTWLCHLILGIAIGGAPVGAWIAIRGDISIIALAFGAAAMFWVAGFDIIYGTQDIEFDRANDIHSIPAKFGIEKALTISSAFHFISVSILLGLYFLTDFGILYLLGVAIVGALLAYEHCIVSPENLSNVTFASYNVNELVGLVLMVFASADLIL